MREASQDASGIHQLRQTLVGVGNLALERMPSAEGRTSDSLEKSPDILRDQLSLAETKSRIGSATVSAECVPPTIAETQ